MGCVDLVYQVSAPVYFLVILFAWASWIDINGLFVEVPLMVGVLPEGWNLPSYMAVIIQVANIGPIAYTVATKIAPGRIKEWPIVYVICVVGATSCLLLAFLWDRTTVIGGTLHSSALLSLTAFLALVDCTSSVVFLPYMSQFRPEYMTGYYIGEGLSGLIPGLVGLIQGVGSDPECVNNTVVTTNTTTMLNITEYQVVPVYDPPRFSIQVFFIFLCSMITVSGISFTLLHFLPYCREHRNAAARSYDVNSADDVANGIDNPIQFQNIRSESSLQFSNGGTATAANEENTTRSKTALSKDETAEEDENSRKRLTTAQFVYVLVVVAWLNAILNGLLPSTQSYTCLPYGNLAYTLAIRLSTVANPLMCLVALFFPSRALATVVIMPLIATILAVYQVYLAAMSPFPPLKYETAGVALVIVSSVIMASCIAYSKVTAAMILNDHSGKKGLLWCGIMTQVGSFIGAVSTFLAINVGHVFESEYACSEF